VLFFTAQGVAFTQVAISRVPVKRQAPVVHFRYAHSPLITVRFKMKKALIAAGATATFAAALFAGVTNTASANAPCGKTVSDIDHSSYVTATASGANIRTGSSTGCTSLGLLLQGQRADYYCYTVNSTSGYTWTYLRDVATGKVGWVRDDSLPGNGSYVYCGF
jgi:hypothetical protein